MVQKTRNKPKLRAKIDAKCYECIYDSHAEGSLRKQTKNCTSYACPLYSVRPKTIIVKETVPTSGQTNKRNLDDAI